MKAILICPSERPAVSRLGEDSPVVITPMLGQSLLEYWLSHLAASGFKDVLVLAHDRPDQVLAVAGNGERWGIKVEVTEESRELSPAQALLKHAAQTTPGSPQPLVAALEHFPGFPEYPLFASYAGWFTALRQWLPRALGPDRVGAHEVRPGVYMDAHSHLSPEAVLRGPCWLGKHVFVGAGAVIGPGAIIEDGAFVEPGAEISSSCIGPDTFVGRLARLNNSIAMGSTLINWQTGSLIEVPDPFLLCALRQPRRHRTASWLSRLAEVYNRTREESAAVWKHLLLNKEG